MVNCSHFNIPGSSLQCMGQVAICTVASPFLLRISSGRGTHYFPGTHLDMSDPLDLKPLRLIKSKSPGNQIQEICVWIIVIWCWYNCNMVNNCNMVLIWIWYVLNFKLWFRHGFVMNWIWFGSWFRYGFGYKFDMVLIWCGNGASFSEFPMAWIRNQKRKQPGHAFGRFLEFSYDVDMILICVQDMFEKIKAPPNKKTHAHKSHFWPTSKSQFWATAETISKS